MKKHWWKILGVLLLTYTIIAGFLIDVPDLPIIRESIRNLFFHVCMWFTMILIFLIGFINSIRYLATFNRKYDRMAVEAVNTGLVFGILGLVTGMIWARFAWGDFWTNDPQLNGAAVSLMIYFAYLILRSSLDDEEKRGKVAGVYNIFAFVMLIIFIQILPSMAESSLHPGKGGSPMTVSELDNTMRLVFYPAIAGWFLIGLWIYNIRLRIRNIKDKLKERLLMTK
ncbi:MAG: cytochrome c biogenesis protein [Bacteroidales bacterium]|nr:cytochrome c biogenesis protein [Bacteroidales bacterium]